MIVLFIKGRGIGKKWVSKSSRKQVSDNKANHQRDQAGRYHSCHQRLRTVDVAICGFNCQRI